MFRDGPLRYRPPEEIRYGTGKCALGALLVASSDKGVVTVMIREKAAGLLQELRPRFSKAVLVRDEAGCKSAVEKVAGHVAAPDKPLRLALDLRGTPFQVSVYRAVLKIPFGQTSDYSTIAADIGAPKAVRAVGGTCSNNWWNFVVPCHRVLHKGAAGPDKGRRTDGRQYRWVDYEAKLLAKGARR